MNQNFLIRVIRGNPQLILRFLLQQNLFSPILLKPFQILRIGFGDEMRVEFFEAERRRAGWNLFRCPSLCFVQSIKFMRIN